MSSVLPPAQSTATWPWLFIATFGYIWLYPTEVLTWKSGPRATPLAVELPAVDVPLGRVLELLDQVKRMIARPIHRHSWVRWVRRRRSC